MAVGHGPLTMAVPSGAANGSAASALGAEALEVLYGMGIEYGAIVQTAYDAAGRPDAPIVLMVDRYVADAPACHQRWNDFARTYDGGNTLNFGCANQANLAAVVTDPADLLGPREMSPGDTIRRGVVLGTYRSGETTITERSDAEGAEVSDAVD
jgi:pilus assembly protein CpaD